MRKRAGVWALAILAASGINSGVLAQSRAAHDLLRLTRPFLQPFKPGPSRAVVADFDNDRVPDIVRAEASDVRFHIAIQLSGSTRLVLDELHGHIAELTAVDVNGDGLLDIAVSTTTGRIFIWLNAGRGAFRLVEPNDPRPPGHAHVRLAPRFPLPLFVFDCGRAFLAVVTLPDTSALPEMHVPRPTAAAYGLLRTGRAFPRGPPRSC